jgi:hypothetical protein
MKPSALKPTEVLLVLTTRDLFIIDEALQALCSHQLDKHRLTGHQQYADVAEAVNNTRAPILEARIRLNTKINNKDEPTHGPQNTQPARRKATHRRRANATA